MPKHVSPKKLRRSYADARAEAQVKANLYGGDYGLEVLGDDYHVFRLPHIQYRQGHEVRCEVVYPEDLDKCQPGHGPMARRVGIIIA